MRLKDKAAIVTGAAQGIGEATAIRFAEEGARVVIADVDGPGGEKVAAAIRAKGGAAVAVQTDISKEDEVVRMVQAAARAYGKVDIAVNDAAVFVLKGMSATVEDWQRSLGVNVIGTFLVSKHASEEMKKAGGGAIVNLSSISAFIAQPDFTAYSVTKAAILQMTKNMAMDLAPFNIRVNCVCPGAILTQASFKHMENTGMTLEQFNKEYGALHILNRIGQTREVANAILFLASDEASFITATPLMVDGGLIHK